MTIADDLTSLNIVKNNIKQALVDKGVAFNGTEVLSDIPSKIASMSSIVIYPEKTINITYNPRETTLGTPTLIPTTEPATSQIIYTIQASDLPSFDIQPVALKYSAHLIGAGMNNELTNKTLNYKLLKNGTVISSGTNGMYSNLKWCLYACNIFDVQVGDTLELRLWSASNVNVDLRYFGLNILPTRVFTESQTKPPLLKDIKITSSTLLFSFATQYNCYKTQYWVTGNSNFSIIPADTNDNGYISFGTQDATKGLFSVGRTTNQDTVLYISFFSDGGYRMDTIYKIDKIKYKLTNYVNG